MRELATEAFYAQLKTCTLDRLVLMLDTCEWLNEPEGIEVGQWVLNELLPGIRTRMRQQKKHFFTVIVSRILPRLDAINGRDQRRLALSMLSKIEVDQYLEHLEMQDPELRQRVYEVTHGHALCVSIIGDFWQKRDSQSHPLDLADLPVLQVQEFSEIALMRFTNERVLKQLKSPFKELTRYGVLLRSFDLPFLRNVFPELLPEHEVLERFNQLIRYPYIEPRGNYRYAFHELVREALAEETQREEPDTWLCYHKRAIDYLTQLASHTHDLYYHLFAYDDKKGLGEWQRALEEAQGKREVIGALLQAALDKALRLSPPVQAEVEYEQGRFNYFGAQWEQALKNYKEALNLFQRAGDRTGEAKALHAIGDVQRTLVQQDDALKSYNQAITLFSQLENLRGEAKCRQSMGDVQRLRDKDDALHCYEEALTLFRQIQDRAEEAKVLEAIGDVHQLYQEQDSALKNYQQALALYLELGDRLKRARVLKAIGDTQRMRQEENAALESYGQALALFGELKEPLEEANVRRAIEEMQQGDQPGLSEAYDGPAQQHNPNKTVIESSPILRPPQPNAPIVPRPQRIFSRGRAMLLIGLALLLIAGGAFSFLRLSSVNNINGDATATAQASGTTPNAAKTLTIIDAEEKATAAAQALLFVQATATAQTIEQTATVTALQNLYTQATSGTPKLDDPLTDNSRGYNWDDDGVECAFKGGVYHVVASISGSFLECNTKSPAPNFSDFAYQVNMTIVQGDGGGIILRFDVTRHAYYMIVFDKHGNYNLQTVFNDALPKTLASGRSRYFHTVTGQANQLTIIASGTNLHLYVNKQYVTSVSDTTYHIGQIGMVAQDITNSTDVQFTNAQVWTLT